MSWYTWHVEKDYYVQQLGTVRHATFPDNAIGHCRSASLGVALFVNHGSSQSDVLKWADTAMYGAKDAGRNQVRFHSEEGGTTL